MTTIQVSQADIAAVFELWQRKWREGPSDFLTAEEVAAMSTGDLGERSAIAFMGYLREVRGESPVKVETAA